MMDHTIAELPKNRRETVRVGWNPFKGNQYIDLRVYADNGADLVPTGKGVMLAPSKLPELIAALQKAEAEARTAGLL